MTFQPKLTPTQVASLLTDYANGWDPKELAIIYKVSIRTVYRKLALIPDRKPKTKKKRSHKKKKVRPPLKPCGTDAAYVRHKRKGEYPCTDCLQAHALSVKIYKDKPKKKGRKK